jgi:preprotein translocase subunit SecG
MEDLHMSESLPRIGTPRWVKVAAIIALVVGLIFVILLLTGGGAGHGPSRHAQSDAAVAGSAPSVSTEHLVQQP